MNKMRTRRHRFTVRVGKGYEVFNFKTYESFKSVNECQCYKDPDVAKRCLLYMKNMLSYQQSKQTKPKPTFFRVQNIQCLLSEVDVENNGFNKAYIATTLSKEEIVENHKSSLPQKRRL